MEEWLPKTSDVVLQAGFWNPQLLFTSPLRLDVMEVENHRVLLPIGLQEEVGAWTAMTRLRHRRRRLETSEGSVTK